MSLSISELYEVYTTSGVVAATLCCRDVEPPFGWAERVSEWLTLTQMPELLSHMDLSWCPIGAMITSFQLDRQLIDQLGDLKDNSRFSWRFPSYLVQSFPEYLLQVDYESWDSYSVWEGVLKAQPDIMWEHGKIVIDAMYKAQTGGTTYKLNSSFDYQALLDRCQTYQDVRDEVKIMHPMTCRVEKSRLRGNIAARRKARMKKANAV